MKGRTNKIYEWPCAKKGYSEKVNWSLNVHLQMRCRRYCLTRSIKKGANIARERASRTHFYELGIRRLHFLEGKKLLNKKAIYEANGYRSFIFWSH